MTENPPPIHKKKRKQRLLITGVKSLGFRNSKLFFILAIHDSYDRVAQLASNNKCPVRRVEIIPVFPHPAS